MVADAACVVDRHSTGARFAYAVLSVAFWKWRT
jgi:hypothetical protein